MKQHAAYKLLDKAMRDRAEVCSILRSLKIPKETLITRDYDDGTFHCRSTR
jgi:hypothetical protein